MIYLDTSVALAHLLAEDRVPPDALWDETLVSSRLLEPFPVPVRTLDALHLASIEFLRAQRQDVTLASTGSRMIEAARRLMIPIAVL